MILIEGTDKVMLEEGNIPVRPHNKDLFVHSEIFSIPTPYISTNSTIGLFLQETLDYRPWLDTVS